MFLRPKSILNVYSRLSPSCKFGLTRSFHANGVVLDKTPVNFQDRLRKWMALFDESMIMAMQKFHDVTGYSEIDKLKRTISEVEDAVKNARDSVKSHRSSYTESLTRRSTSQHEMNELLLRKQTWTPVDLERFTQLYKDDHAIAQTTERAKSSYAQSETRLEELQLQLGRLIGQRYREEQLWSDKIRQASTWGTWMLMAINIILFIIVQLLVEPWKRKRLVASFEQKVAEMLNDSALTKSTTEPPSTTTDSDAIVPTEQVLTWNNLWDRLQCPNIILRPIEVLAAWFVMPLICATVTALVVHL